MICVKIFTLPWPINMGFVTYFQQLSLSFFEGKLSPNFKWEEEKKKGDLKKV